MSELYHHGILGQKWGVRRAKNYPLSLEDHSPEQIKKNPEIRRQLKLAKIAEKTQKRIEKASNKLNTHIEQRLRKGDDADLKVKAKSMTKEELENEIKRLDLEKRYVDLMKSMNPEQRKRESAVKETVGKALKNIGGQAVTAILGEAWNKLVENQGHGELTVNPKKGQKDK